MLKIVKSSNYNENKQTVITIGTFDGVHIGHQKIITHLVSRAKEQDCNAVVLTFFPHPRMVLQKDANIKLITTIDERADILEKLGLDVLVIERFTKEYSRQSAEDFVKHTLVNSLKIRTVIVGYDHRFGRNRSSDVTHLRSFGKTYGFDVEEISMKDVNDVAVSSTKIRKALDEGDVQKANKYLGYAFVLTGEVVKGTQLGRDIGFPTANLNIPETYKLIPKQGVYVVSSAIEGITYYGMMNIGVKPTVSGKEQTIEVHFFDFNTNIYKTKIKVNVLHRLRDEHKFDSVDALKQQLQKDKQLALAWLKNGNT